MTRVWVSQTDLAHSLLAHSPLSFSRAPPATDVAAAIACRSRPSPVTSAAVTWAYDEPPRPSSSSTKWIWNSSPLRWDRGSISARVLTDFCRLWAHSPPDLLSVLAMHSCSGPGVCASPVEAPSAVLPVVLWWRLPQVASGRPHGHCPAIPSRHTPGHTVSVFFFSSTPLLSSPAMVSGHLAMTSEPSSQA
jgi:hypothetical protein